MSSPTLEDPVLLASDDEVVDSPRGSNGVLTAFKLVAAAALFYSAGTSFAETYHRTNNASPSVAGLDPADLGMSAPSNHRYGSPTGSGHGRRLADATISKTKPPSYMKDLMEDLTARKKLMEETPPEEVKYWFEYTGPLQVSFSTGEGSADLLLIGGQF